MDLPNNIFSLWILLASLMVRRVRLSGSFDGNGTPFLKLSFFHLGIPFLILVQIPGCIRIPFKC